MKEASGARGDRLIHPHQCPVVTEVDGDSLGLELVIRGVEAVQRHHQVDAVLGGDTGIGALLGVGRSITHTFTVAC